MRHTHKHISKMGVFDIIRAERIYFVQQGEVNEML